MTIEIDFIEENGQRNFGNVTLYALSTCGFCKLALEFLRCNSIKFRYTYMDELDYSVKCDVKAELEKTHMQKIAYPFLVLDNGEHLVGFIKSMWESKFKI